MTAELEDYQQGDLKELESLFLAADPRTIPQIIEEDTTREEHEIEKVTVEGSDGRNYALGFNHGWLSSFTFPEGHRPPEIGDKLTIFGGFGYPRHGFAINGEVVEYQTPWEQFAERISMLAQHDRNRRESAEKMRPDMDEWYALLEGPYKARIDRFRAEKPDFEIEGGGYELYPVLMAQRIGKWANQESEKGTKETPIEENSGTTLDHSLIHQAGVTAAIRYFHDEMDHDETVRIIHDGKEDKYGISGHQFNFACGMALAVAEGKDI